MKSRWKIRAALLVTLCAAVAVFGWIRWTEYRDGRTWPSLRIGDDAARTGPIIVPIVPPVELDRMSKSDVLALRSQAVARTPSFFDEDYTPAEMVYGDIADGHPWWGIEGQFITGPGRHSIDGPSEEARFLLNPLLLIAPEFHGLSLWGRRPFWANGVDAVTLNEADVAPYPTAVELTWFPAQRRGQVTYDVSAWLATTARLRHASGDPLPAKLSLNPINAYELGLSTMRVDVAASKGVHAPGRAQSSTTRCFIHEGGSCGYPGNCNNASGPAYRLEFMMLTELPAHVVVQLYEHGASANSGAPDFTWTIRFR
ncbi:MAG: hypothetical protein JKY37_34110 [Nannocystaceae bacterium]|nr:hypothetical protein [Nannocystaceae bacterium]